MQIGSDKLFKIWIWNWIWNNIIRFIPDNAFVNIICKMTTFRLGPNVLSETNHCKKLEHQVRNSSNARGLFLLRGLKQTKSMGR